jgi:hypothetical protein
MKSLIKIPNNQFSEIYSSFLHIFLHNTLFLTKKLELNSGINMKYILHSKSLQVHEP